MGLLDGDISALFSAAFSGMYLDGTLTAGTGDPTYSTDGTITGYSSSSTAIKVQIDTATEAMRRADGFAEGDVRIIILADGIGDVTSDNGATIGGKAYRLLSADLDAAASHWVCRARLQ